MLVPLSIDAGIRPTYTDHPVLPLRHAREGGCTGTPRAAVLVCLCLHLSVKDGSFQGIAGDVE